MARVYSTETGRICPRCNAAKGSCRCAPGKQKIQSASPPTDGFIRIFRETKGRKGAGVTLIKGLSGESDDLKQLAKQLKQLCGCGGAVKGDCIEIQGNQREKIKQWLEAKDYKVKLAGG
jgi:translation initiation factor 1